MNKPNNYVKLIIYWLLVKKNCNFICKYKNNIILPSLAIHSVESKGLTLLLGIDSNFWPNDKCFIIWDVFKFNELYDCTSWTKN